MNTSSSWLDSIAGIYQPYTNQVRDRSWLQCLEEYGNRNSKWLDSIRIKWNTEKRILPNLSIADQWVLQESIKKLDNSRAQSVSEVVRMLYELNDSHTKNKSVVLDSDLEPASDIEIEELLGVQRGDTISGL